MKYLFFEIAKDEADASLAIHGDARVCGVRGCHAQPIVTILFKKPGSAWGEDISRMGCCLVHEDEIVARFGPSDALNVVIENPGEYIDLYIEAAKGLDVHVEKVGLDLEVRGPDLHLYLERIDSDHWGEPVGDA